MYNIDLFRILKDVFRIKYHERVIVMFDTPTSIDTENWKWRRDFARWCYRKIKEYGYSCDLVHYSATGKNNKELPFRVYKNGYETDLYDVMSISNVVISLTEYSATASLKKLSKKFYIRVASMPGFNIRMEKALMLDYKNISKKVLKVSTMLKDSEYAQVVFDVKGDKYELLIDLSKNSVLKDDGDCSMMGSVINLPSGEAFMTPNEDETSQTQGFLPIQINGKVSIYQIRGNKIVNCFDTENLLMKRINKDPAVGNIAEVAFGVLGDYGLKACGRTLHDEKLGFHIALGRSDHFGGKTSPKKFISSENVWHQDYVYTEDMQPDVKLIQVRILRKGNIISLIENNKLRIF